MKKLGIFIAVFGIAIGLMSSSALATSASFTTSRSASTITVGNNVTFTVRVNSGTNAMDSAQATLNFDSSKLQYVTHSGGTFSPVVQNVGASSFAFAGAIFGGSTSGNQTLFSITFKSVATGTASTSLSGVRAALSGSDLSITSASGSSVSIEAQATSSPTPPPSSSTPSTSTPSSSPTTQSPSSSSPTRSTSEPTNQETVELDTTPPVIQGEPEFQVTKSTIIAKVLTDEPSKITVRYSLKDSDDIKQTESGEISQTSEIVIGRDEPLQAGRTYVLRITLTDEAGNVSEEKSYEAKTEGVEYTVRIVDKNGQPLANYPVTLFSEPIESMTDDDGVARFGDVTPGEHTVVFEIDGVTIRQPVIVGEQLALLSSSEQDISEIVLPFGVTVPEIQGSRSFSDIILALGIGVVLTILVERVWRFGWHKKLANMIKKSLKAKNKAIKA
jgi:hypothetical protein